MPIVNLGRIGFVNKGNYLGGVTVYKVNDIVKYLGSVYVCIQPHSTEHLPTDVLYWNVWVDTADYYTRSQVDSLVATEVGTPIASASTIPVGTVNAGDVVHITGTTTIDSLGLGTTGMIRTLVFDGALTIVHHGTSMVLPGGESVLTVAGTSATFVCENGALGYWRCTDLMNSAVSMADLQNISTLTGNAQAQLDLRVSKDSSTGAAYIPSGTTAQRPVTPASGYMRFNTTLSSAEVWNGTMWTPVGGGATGGGADTVFVETSYTITTDYTVTAGKSATTVGDANGNVTINDGITVTIPDSSSWVILGG